MWVKRPFNRRAKTSRTRSCRLCISADNLAFDLWASSAVANDNHKNLLKCTHPSKTWKIGLNWSDFNASVLRKEAELSLTLVSLSSLSYRPTNPHGLLLRSRARSFSYISWAVVRLGPAPPYISPSHLRPGP